jgi:hypothetical protein
VRLEDRFRVEQHVSQRVLGFGVAVQDVAAPLAVVGHDDDLVAFPVLRAGFQCLDHGVAQAREPVDRSALGTYQVVHRGSVGQAGGATWPPRR